MYLALRIISASALLGLFVSRSLSEKKVIFYFPLLLVAASVALMFEHTPTLEVVRVDRAIINISLGLILGSIFSIPIFAADFIAQNIIANFKNRSVCSTKIAITLGLLILIFNLDFFPYFFSIIIKTSKIEQSFFENPDNFLNVGRLAFSSFASYLLPAFAAFVSTFIFFSLLSIISPSLLNTGLKFGVKVMLTLCLMLFYFTYSSSFFHELMREVTDLIRK
jgi:type III secretory pathway component EscT